MIYSAQLAGLSSIITDIRTASFPLLSSIFHFTTSSNCSTYSFGKTFKGFSAFDAVSIVFTLGFKQILLQTFTFIIYARQETRHRPVTVCLVASLCKSVTDRQFSILIFALQFTSLLELGGRKVQGEKFFNIPECLVGYCA